MTKDQWIEYMMPRTGLKYEVLSREFDSNFKENTVGIFNSVNGLDTKIPANKFLSDLYDHQIIVENGVIFQNHDVFTALPVSGILALTALRDIYKGQMKKAISNGDILGARINDGAQLSTKENTNTWYGIQANPMSKVYNYDIACSITARGRGTVSINGLTLESLFGSYRSYNVVALLDFIVHAAEKNIPKHILDNIPNIDEEGVVKHVLGEHYSDSYYGIGILRAKIKALSDDDKKKVYYTSNYAEFIKIPEVSRLLKEIIIKQNIAYDEIKKIQAMDISETDKLKMYKDHIYLDALKPPKNIQEEYDKLIEWVNNLLIGFYWYEGDVNKYGESYVAPEFIFKSIERESVILTDTDSLIFSLGPYAKKIEELYPDYSTLVNNLNGLDEFVLGSIVIAVAGKAIDLGLEQYTEQSLITERFRKNIQYKQEFVFKSLQTTQGAKNYLGVISIQEGVYLPNEKLDLKGLSLKKTNFNKFLAEKASYIAEHMIAKTKVPDPKQIFDEIDRIRQQMPEIFRARDNLDIFTVAKLKTGYGDSEIGEARFKSVENYNVLFNDRIPLPGAFLMTKIDLKDADEYIMEKYPEIYGKLMNLCATRSRNFTINSIKNRISTLWVDELAPEFVLDIVKDIEELNTVEEIAEYIKTIKKIYKDKDLSDNERYWMDKLGVKKVKLKDIDKIALPIDNETVPEFISDHIDLNEIAVFENLIAVIIKGLGFEVIRNNGGKKQINHNIISYY